MQMTDREYVEGTEPAIYSRTLSVIDSTTFRTCRRCLSVSFDRSAVMARVSSSSGDNSPDSPPHPAFETFAFSVESPRSFDPHRGHSRAADQDSRQENQHAAHHYLKCRGQQWRVHVAVADERDDGQFDCDHYDRDTCGDLEAVDEVRQRVTDSAGGGHEPANKAAHPGMSAAGELAIIGQCFSETHADACAE
jgi:hypothetical protein